MDCTGVIVRDSLVDLSVLDYVGVIEARQKELGISGIWNVLEVLVQKEDFDKVIKLLETKCLAPAWFAVFKRADRVMIVFKGKHFNIKKGSKHSLTEVKNWAFEKFNIMPETFNLDI